MRENFFLFADGFFQFFAWGLLLGVLCDTAGKLVRRLRRRNL